MTSFCDEHKESNKLSYQVSLSQAHTDRRVILGSKTSKAGSREGEGVIVLTTVAFRGKLDTFRDRDRWVTELETTE